MVPYIHQPRQVFWNKIGKAKQVINCIDFVMTTAWTYFQLLNMVITSNIWFQLKGHNVLWTDVGTHVSRPYHITLRIAKVVHTRIEVSTAGVVLLRPGMNLFHISQNNTTQYYELHTLCVNITKLHAANNQGGENYAAPHQAAIGSSSKLKIIVLDSICCAIQIKLWLTKQKPEK